MYEEDLQKLFVGEVQERTGRLVAGAGALMLVPCSVALRDGAVTKIRRVS